jgi:hypothetical protein
MATRVKEARMKTAKRTLRSSVEKWLLPATSVRLTRFSHRGASRRRYIHVEAERPQGPVGLFFFRHDDGTWQVFPPGNEGPVAEPAAKAAETAEHDRRFRLEPDSDLLLSAVRRTGGHGRGR